MYYRFSLQSYGNTDIQMIDLSQEDDDLLLVIVVSICTAIVGILLGVGCAMGAVTIFYHQHILQKQF